MQVLHNATFDRERIAHEKNLKEIAKELPLRDPDEYYAELEFLANKYGLKLPDPKS